MSRLRSVPRTRRPCSSPVPGETIDFCVIYGPTPKQILDRYTKRGGTSGQCARMELRSVADHLVHHQVRREATINSFIDGMAERDIPLSAFHYDCYWMREFHWCDFEWDKRFFGDIETTLKRLHEDKGLQSAGADQPVYRPARLHVQGRHETRVIWSASRMAKIWQTDFWQAGMGLWTSPIRMPVNGSRTRSRSC